ncbi:hypothetical protein FQZ97_991380 [compost metagenome]
MQSPDLRKLQYVSVVLGAGVQKARAHGATKPVWLLMALAPTASCRISWLLLSRPSLYCLRLPFQRGNASWSGRNMPTNTWFR